MFKGPIDPKTGWPTVHRLLTVEAKSIDEARKHFEKKFPGDVAHVYAEP
jgi:hypothetical protein